MDQAEDHLIFSAVTDDGVPLDPDAATRLLTLPGTVSPLPADEGPGHWAEALAGQAAAQRSGIKRGIAERNRKRRSLFDAQDEVDRQREALIDAIEGKLTQTAHLGTLFTVRWSLR